MTELTLETKDASILDGEQLSTVVESFTASLEIVGASLQEIIESITENKAIQKLREMAIDGNMLSSVEIKKMIKREKNPMRKKQLQQDLNEAYKREKRKKVKK